MIGKFYRATVWAIRDSETKERLSYRYDSWIEAARTMGRYAHTGRVVEIYKTTMAKPIACKKRGVRPC